MFSTASFWVRCRLCYVEAACSASPKLGWILTLGVIVLGDRVLGRRLGLEGGVPVNRIKDFLEDIFCGSFATSHHLKTQWVDTCMWSRNQTLSEHQICLLLVSPASRKMRNTFCYLEATQPLAFCVSNSERVELNSSPRIRQVTNRIKANWSVFPAYV